MEHTSIELIGSDRPGLLSEVSAILTQLKCNVVNAEVWTHNTRAAAVMQVTDEKTGGAVTDPDRLTMVKRRLCPLLKGGNSYRKAKTVVSNGSLTRLEGFTECCSMTEIMNRCAMMIIR